MNMLPLKSLALLILGVSLVRGDYWWMETDAFGGDSDSQVKRASSAGYGGGGGIRKTHNVGGYPTSGGVNFEINDGNGSFRPPTNQQNLNNPTNDQFQDYSGNLYFFHLHSNPIPPQMLSVQPV